jgi:hypothetical protein
MWAMAALNKAGLADAQTADELASGRTLSNMLVIGSGVAGAAAVGLGVSAFVSHDGARIGLHLDF